MLEDSSTDEVTKNGSQTLPVSRHYSQFLGIDVNPLSDGGVETTLAVITRFIMSMILYPRAQRRESRADIDYRPSRSACLHLVSNVRACVSMVISTSSSRCESFELTLQ